MSLTRDGKCLIGDVLDVQTIEVGHQQGNPKEYGYEMHGKVKLRVMSYKGRQSVTGLVVNENVSLPRKVRKWLRAVEHYRTTGRQTTLSDAQIGGWKSLRQMIIDQRKRS